MPKYIDFDALGVQSCNPDIFVNKGYAKGWNSLMQILYDAPAADVEPKQRWIPVTERLPEAEYGEGQSVLTVDICGEQRVLYFDGGNWCWPTGEPLKTSRSFPVTHWMPLPEPPGSNAVKGADYVG